MHVGDQLVEQLAHYGIRYVFGVPGGQTLPLYNAIAKRSDIEHVLVRDERSGVYAADAYARATGRLGVCDATVGPGASNLVSGLVEAYSSSVPVLAIVADIPRGWEHRRRLGSASQAFNQRGFLEECVRWYGRVETPENLSDILHSCVRIATAGRPGPVVLEIPDDVFEDTAVDDRNPASPEWTQFPRVRSVPEPAAVEQAVSKLETSRRPLVIAGGGAVNAGAEDAIRSLVERLGVPVATTLTGKGIIPETHPKSIGVVGSFGIPLANELVAMSDCIVFVGCKTGQLTTMGWTVPELETSVIHIDVDPEELGRNYRDTIGLWGDARVGTKALANAFDDGSREYEWDFEQIGQLREAWWDDDIDYRSPREPGILKPQDIVRIIRESMSEEDAIVADASLASGWAASRWQIQRTGRHFFAPRGLAGLGWGLPATIGVAKAWDQRASRGRVIGLAGDGGWGYSMAEVETAVREGLPIICIILNNSSLAWIKHSSENRFPDNMTSEDFVGVSYAEAAGGLGARTAQVDTLDAFESTLCEAIENETDQPWVIEAITCDNETPLLSSGDVEGGGY